MNILQCLHWKITKVYRVKNKQISNKMQLAG